MKWAAAHSRLADPEAAADEVATQALEALGDGPVDLALFFVTAPLVAGVEALAERLRDRLRPGDLAGTSGGAVIGADRAFERGPALALLAARLPGVEVKPFILVGSSWGDAAEDPLEFARHTPGVEGAELVMLLADPMSLDVERVLTAFNRHAAGVRVVGGIASAGFRPQANALVLNDWVGREGGIGIALRGALRADVVVSQGCRPIGPPLAVTRAEQNVIVELDGRPALDRTEEVLRALSPGEQAALQNGLYVGRPVRSSASGRGDYLIRNLLGADRQRKVLAVNDRVREAERVRLHVRDANTAREDLELLLAPQEFDSRAQAALLFSCNGRGSGFFERADQDVETLQEALGGGVPAAGFFCAGEVGPVGGGNFLHGHTASIAIVRPVPVATSIR